jgi:hypothetical protein
LTQCCTQSSSAYMAPLLTASSWLVVCELPLTSTAASRSRGHVAAAEMRPLHPVQVCGGNDCHHLQLASRPRIHYHQRPSAYWSSDSQHRTGASRSAITFNIYTWQLRMTAGPPVLCCHSSLPHVPAMLFAGVCYQSSAGTGSISTPHSTCSTPAAHRAGRACAKGAQALCDGEHCTLPGKSIAACPSKATLCWMCSPLHPVRSQDIESASNRQGNGCTEFPACLCT